MLHLVGAYALRLVGSSKNSRAQTSCLREQTEQVTTCPRWRANDQRTHSEPPAMPPGTTADRWVRVWVRTSRNRCLRCLHPALSSLRTPRSHVEAAVCSRFRFQPVRVRLPSAPPPLVDSARRCATFAGSVVIISRGRPRRPHGAVCPDPTCRVDLWAWFPHAEVIGRP